jgi:peptidoglycan/LPS O-acetylase OafA/YrhL
MKTKFREHMLTHRTDIDGLRAFAIIPVLLFHSGFKTFSGGFVGVDVFFTISGFLITSIILKDIENKNFNYMEFFKRRVRRLMPMAILIYVFVLSLFFFIYPSIYFKDVSAAVISSLFFISNIFFWKEGGGYFGRNVEINPLLHTWSLSVEEQFYLIFPFLLILLFCITHNAKQKIIWVSLGILFSLSIAIIYAPSIESHAAFYLLPPRMYELAIGSLTALFVFYRPHHGLRTVKYLQEAGLILVILPVFIFDENTLFPSFNALFPCLGAAFIMLSIHSYGWASVILNSRFAISIGLISYSLYLWH